MVKKISIRNFQSWQSLDIDLTSNTVAIVGPSNCGKSSIVRALIWLVYNEPSGDKFRSNFCRRGDATIVSVEMADGTKVERVRSASMNSATITYPDGKSVELEKCGAGTVDAIARVLRISPFAKQSQHDSAFLLSYKSTDLEKLLNSVCNYSLLDDIIDTIAADKRETSLAIKRLEEQMKEKAKAALIGWSAFMPVEEYERWESIRKDILNNIDELSLRVPRLERLQTLLDGVDANVLSIDLNALESKRGSTVSEYQKLSNLVSTIDRVEGILANITEVTVDETDISTVANTRGSLLTSLQLLTSISRKVDELIASRKKHLAEVESIQHQLDGVEVCPLCGTKGIHLG